MLTKRQCGDVIWVDLENPTQEEDDLVVKEYAVHELIAKELLTSTPRSRVDMYDTQMYLILHFPTIVNSDGNKTEQEVDFVLGKNFLITAHYESINVLDEFAKRIEAEEVAGTCSFFHAGFFFFELMTLFYRNTRKEHENLWDHLEDIEQSIFRGEERLMVEEISKTSRSLLDFKKSFHTHKEILNSFDEASRSLYGDEFNLYAKKIVGEQYRIAEALDSSIEILKELRETNNSLLTTKTNDIMRTLTIMAFITFPLSLIASLFSMNTNFLPLEGQEYDFWIVVGIMLFAMICFLWYFKKKRWF